VLIKPTAIKTKLTSTYTAASAAAAATIRSQVIVFYLNYLTEESSIAKCSITLSLRISL